MVVRMTENYNNNNIDNNETDEARRAWAEKLYTQFLSDDNNWDKVNGREIERRVDAYKAKGDDKDVLAKLLSALWVGEFNYLYKVNGEYIGFAMWDSEQGPTLDLFTNKKQIGKEVLSALQTKRTLLPALLDTMEPDLPTFILINPNTQRLLFPVALIKKTFKTFKEVTDKIEKAMADGIPSESLHDLLFERFAGRMIECELVDGRKIEGDVYSKKNVNGEIILYVDTEEDSQFELRKSTVKFIKDITDFGDIDDYSETDE
jgi:hypothetical protein